VPKKLATQINGSDCGMHTCLNMELIARHPGYKDGQPAFEIELNRRMDQERSDETRRNLMAQILIGRLL